MSDNLEQLHDESVKPKSVQELASEIDLSVSRKDIAENNTKEVLTEVLKINGITHETLNISPTKFKRLSKPQLVDLIFNGAEQEKKESTKESGDNVANYLDQIITLKDLLAEAYTTKDYKKLDSVMAKSVLEAVTNDKNVSKINVNPQYFLRVIIALGSIYFVARLYGFENIETKIKATISKFKGKKTDEKLKD